MSAGRARPREIDRKADLLLEGLAPETRGFIDGKIRNLAAEKDRLQHRLAELDTLHYQPIDEDAVLAHGKAALNDLRRRGSPRRGRSSSERSALASRYCPTRAASKSRCKNSRPRSRRGREFDETLAAGARNAVLQTGLHAGIFPPCERSGS